MKTRLRLRVKECLAAREKRTGEHLSYRDLAKKTGLSYDTIKALASRPGYNASLRTIEQLCDALGVGFTDIVATERR
jgi:DNA-binding Xre family transcriptional regulator